jgi:hypothetical protein
VRHLDDLQPESRRERADDLRGLRVQRLGDDHLLPPRRQAGDEARVRRRGHAVVARRVRDVHPGQLADRRLVLEDRLQHALAHLRLVRRVGGQELPALHHHVDDRGHVAVVHPGAQEGQLAAGVDVARRQLRHVGDQLGLGQRRPHVQRPAQPQALGDVGEQLGQRADADPLQHHLEVALGQRREGHSASTNAW